MTEKEREALIELLTARYAESLRKGLADEPQTLDEIEQRVEDIGRAAELELERRLLERRERPERPEDNLAACPQCQQPARLSATGSGRQNWRPRCSIVKEGRRPWNASRSGSMSA